MLQDNGIGANGRKGVKVLTEQEDIHNILGLCAVHLLRELRNRRLKTMHDRLTLPSNAQTGQVAGFGLGLGGLGELDLVGLGLVGGSLLEAAGGVDLVHGGFDLGVGGQVGNEAVDDLVAVILHHITELRHNGGGDVGLRGKRIIEFHARDGGTHHVKHITLDLASGIAEAVVRIVGRSDQDAVLDGDGHLDKDIVLGLGLANDVELLDAKGEPTSHRRERPANKMESRVDKRAELAEVLDDSNLVCADALEAHATHFGRHSCFVWLLLRVLPGGEIRGGMGGIFLHF
mmetsp:Transcript_17630/g.29304  ORF Transcript_17630/g.29304 Transcript_17630/m.29304 type:complete len:288 (+) Transcript_17630:281-1144(+)